VRKVIIGACAALALAIGALLGVADAASQNTLSLSVDANRYAGPTPLGVKFSAVTSQAHGAVRYRWCFDDGKQSQDQNPTHAFRRAGYYTVTVQAQDESGDQERKTLLLGVWPPKQWADAQQQPITKRGAARAQRVQQRRTRKRRKELKRRDGLTREKCISRPLG
jgi:PKD domain-containing protein